MGRRSVADRVSVSVTSADQALVDTRELLGAVI
jgi:hypothetical protein